MTLLALAGLTAAGCGSRQAHVAPPATTSPPVAKLVLPIVGPPRTIVPPTTAVAQAVTVAAAGIALTRYSTCDEFLASVKTQALAEVTAAGLPWPGPWGMGGPAVAAPGMAGGATAAPSGAGAGGAGAGGAAGSSGNAGAATPQAAASPGGFSATNNQEPGVDELDSTKTDGRVLVTLAPGPSGQTLHVLDVTGTPRLAGTLALSGQYPTGLFLVGHDAVVIGQSNQAPPTAAPSVARSSTAVSVIDLTDPDHPRVARTFGVDGSEVAARLIGQSIKLVVTSAPVLPLTSPADGSPAATAKALAANRGAINASSLAEWLPSVTDATGHRHLAACGEVSHSAQPEGLDTVSVVTIDPNSNTAGAAETVLADAQTVYASATRLYVAAMNVGSTTPSGQRTVVHAFDISDTNRARYLGSGDVAGTILNQYSLSELGGDLRMATTLGVPTPPPGEGGPVQPGSSSADQPGGSQSFVTVLRLTAGALVPIGQVGGLGHGQKIFAVRFIGTQGYVVTFRQLDPLYVVDLSDPFHPAVRGALELSGYSAYLHPLDASHLLGVGGSADANGRRTGLQLSLFDVHDPGHPTLVAQADVPGGYSSAEQDPHALLWWATTNLAVLPAQSYDNGTGREFQGAIGFHVDASHGISEVGRISHDPPSSEPCAQGAPQGGAAKGGAANGGAAQGAAPACGPQPWAPIQRDLVIGPRVYSLSPAGVVVSDLATLHQTAWLAFSG